MPLDPSIALNVQGLKMPDPMQMLSMAQMAQQLQNYPQQVEAQKLKMEAERQNIAMNTQEMQAKKLALEAQTAFQRIAADPANHDPRTGGYTPEALQKMMAVSPKLGMDTLTAQSNQALAGARTRQADAAADENTFRRQQQSFETTHDIAAGGIDAYERAIKQGAPQGEAIRQATELRAERVDEAVKANLINAETGDQIKKSPFDPQKVRDHIVSAKSKLAEWAAAEKSTEKRDEKAPEHRRIIRGGQEIDQEYDPKGKAWKDISSGPRWDPNRTSAHQFTPAAADLMAALAEKNVSLPAGMRSKDQQIATAEALLTRHPNKTPDEIAEMIKSGVINLATEKKELTTAAGQAGKIAVSQKEIKTFGPLVLAASAKVPRGIFVPWSQLKQIGDSKISDPNLKVLKVQMRGFENAYEALAARGGTDKDKRAHIQELFNTADGPEAIKALVDAVNQEGDAAEAAAREAMQRHPATTPGNASGGEKPDYSHLWKK
ncbi:MAG TPA: hypothetical protein VGM15_03205 [Burkholderiaceae bacterium]|jgi:hypothetical protein